MDTNNTDFLEIILNGGEQADKAMFRLLHQHLNHQLRQRFEVYQYQLFDDFDDIVNEFLLYLREGKEGDGTYPSLRRIEKRESLEPWMLNTFRNYLSARAAKEGRITYTGLYTEKLTESNVSSILTNEEMLSIASHLIAYAHQVFQPRDRFIFFREMLTLLNKKKALPNEAMAKALGMTYVSYRGKVYRLKCRLAEYHTKLLQGERLSLDDKHQQMAQQINDDFLHLYPTLLGYYDQSINNLDCAETVRQLRRNHYLATGSIMHEPEPNYSTTLSIEAFWNMLNRFLIV